MLLNERYKIAIRQSMVSSLIRRISSQIIEPYNFNLSPDIENKISSAVDDIDIPNYESDNLGNQLQVIGEQLAEEYYSSTIKKLAPIFYEQLQEKRSSLQKDIDSFIEEKQPKKQRIDCEAEMTQLKEHIQRGLIGRSSSMWRGADVRITAKQVPTDWLPPSHSDDIQVITGSDDLAFQISWLFERLRDINFALLDYLSKYRFYGEMAEAANKVISEGYQNESEIYLAIWNQADKAQKILLLCYYKKYKRTKKDLYVTRPKKIKEAEEWIIAHTN
jgi:hypothetical protein